MTSSGQWAFVARAIIVVLGALMFSLPGCLLVPIAYGVAASAISTERLKGGDIEIKPFEDSLMLSPDARQKLQEAKSIAIAPFAGDMLAGDLPVMATAFTQHIQQSARVRVISPFEFSKQANMNDLRFQGLTELDEVELAKTTGAKVGADLVLYGKVTRGNPDHNMWSMYAQMMIPGKTKIPKNLSLRLHAVTDGTLVWRDDVPFIIHAGTKPPTDAEVGNLLAGHVLERLKELGLMQ